MRRNTRVFIGCITTLIILGLFFPVSGLNITYTIADDGARYTAVAILNQTDRYDFVQSGMLGERVPLEVRNVTLLHEGQNVSFRTEREGIRFNTSNYTLMFDGAVSGNTFQTQFPDPGRVTIILPEKYNVDNPLLTSIQPGGAGITRGDQNTTLISWEKARYIDIRFYDATQENFLGIFAQFWLIIAVLLLMPFLFAGRRQG